MVGETTPQSILKQVFGYDTFRPLQQEVIENVLARRDALVVLPSGGGKSLCYQIPALLFKGLTVVVSPLIALMKDQVEQLHELAVPAVFLNSSLSTEEFRETIIKVRSGQMKLLYVAPEMLLTPRLLSLLSSIHFDCLAIDEAHCISEWGHDFRPEYRQLVEVRRQFPQVVCIALTATATPRVRKDIQESLDFSETNEFISSFDRENLLIEVVPKNNPYEQALQVIRQYPGQSGIIYCFSRKQVDDVAASLSRSGFSVRPYHAGLTDEERKTNQESFIRDDAQIIVATIAFGMGINKPNVRFIIHYDLPKSVEGYYQEIGRAGRDGLPAHCVLLYGYGDVQKLRYFIEQKEAGERKMAYQHLAAMTRYAESRACRRIPLLGYLGETYQKKNCGSCDNCLAAPKELIDRTIPAQKLLSCVIRSGQRFGSAHVIDILLGDGTEKVTKNGHEKLTTFGIGKDLNKEEWMDLSRQLVSKGFLALDDEFGSLRVTDQGHEILRNRQPIMLAAFEKKEAPRPLQRGANEEYEKALFDLLRARRKQLADMNQVPPYVIFSDRSLVEMAAYFPQTNAKMLEIHGVGAAKMQHYGDIFLGIIREYCAEKGLVEKDKPASSPKRQENQTKARAPRKREVAEAFNRGETIQSLAAHYDVQITTILDHLSSYALEGNRLRMGDDVIQMAQLPLDVYEAAIQAFQANGTQYLKPVFDHLNGQLNYDQLKILRVHYLMNINP